MKNEHDDISIDPSALKQTILQCHIVYEQVQRKTNQSLLSLIIRFLTIDFRMYLLFAMLGLIGVFLVIIIDEKSALGCSFIYFFLLGLLVVFEFYKNRYYHTSEIISPVYLNQGRSIIIKSASITILEFAFFIILMTFLSAMKINILSQSIIRCLIPLYLSQIVTMHLLKFIRGYISALTLYCIFYFTYYAVCNTFYFDRFESHVPLSSALLLLLITLILLIFNIWRLYKSTRKEGDKNYGTAIGTY